MADDVESEGILGWARLGCLIAVLGVLPLWAGLTATLLYLWGDDWHEKLGLSGPETVLGYEVVTWVAGAQAAALLGLVTLLGVGGLALYAFTAGWWARRAARHDAERYAAVIGDGAVMRADAWPSEPAGEE